MQNNKAQAHPPSGGLSPPVGGLNPSVRGLNPSVTKRPPLQNKAKTPLWGVAEVALGPLFITPTLDYRIPPPTRGYEPLTEGNPPTGGGTGGVGVGSRVLAPLGKQQRIGIVIRLKKYSKIPTERLRPITKILDEKPLWDPKTLYLILWAAKYWQHPTGQALAYALPQPLRVSKKSIRALSGATASPDEGSINPPQGGMNPPQGGMNPLQGGFELPPREAPSPAEQSPDRSQTGRNRSQTGRSQTGQNRSQTGARREGVVLTDEQQRAVEIVRAEKGFRTFLLDGVTASGKTQVYLKLIEEQLEKGKQCLILTPEIGLTPQLANQIHKHFSPPPTGGPEPPSRGPEPPCRGADPVCEEPPTFATQSPKPPVGAPPVGVVHSGMTGKQKLNVWNRARTGQIQIVVGTRSAIFTPCPNPGLIIVDEEHDPSYKQQDGFKYNARDLAVKRAKLHNIPVILGSATPSTESLRNAEKKRYTHIKLTKKAIPGKPTYIRIIDLNKYPPKKGLSQPLINQMREILDNGGQALVYLNRKGFAPVYMCWDCQTAVECNHCDAKMTFYRKKQILACHCCGATKQPPKTCPKCNATLKPIGHGTERLENEIQYLFPQYNIVRMDRDNIRKKSELENILENIHNQHYRIILGTQMLTKGHDFPNLNMVAVVNADQGLYSQEFKATERFAQMLIQVKGRTGRREKHGLLTIQTRTPKHPLLQILLKQGYQPFANEILKIRKQTQWPPYSCMAILRANAPDNETIDKFLNQAKKYSKPNQHIQILGPVNAQMHKRKNRQHAHLLIKSKQRKELHRFLNQWLPQVRKIKLTKKLAWSMDIDPNEIR